MPLISAFEWLLLATYYESNRGIYPKKWQGTDLDETPQLLIIGGWLTQSHGHGHFSAPITFLTMNEL